jgi:hypothetical protein
MTAGEFCTLIECLTGTPLKNLTPQDEAALGTIVSEGNREIDCTQFNELLLLVNKDRVQPPFFLYFFGMHCRIADLGKGVDKFKLTAMLAFGNFIFAWRVLSRLHTQEEFHRRLGELPIGGDPDGNILRSRPEKLLEIDQIPRDDTPLVGYLSTAVIPEAERARLLSSCASKCDLGKPWQSIESMLQTAVKENEQPEAFAVMNRLRNWCGEDILQCRDYLGKMIPALESRCARLEHVQQNGIRNQDVYLTWDEMDVYFATSMRKAWEYEDLYDFIDELTRSAELKGLNLRYFDPTQSYTPHRIDKGLVESLMLKRAKCTVYSVQDTDTLGKDSELAATLAQGKPVIAYIPLVDVERRARELFDEAPTTISERLRFVLYADEKFSSVVEQRDLQFLRQFEAIHEFSSSIPFSSIADRDADSRFRSEHADEIQRLCKIIAESERRIYDKRANTLKNSHPLGLQVNLADGVANGVLVARSISECATLLFRLLTRTMQFRIDEEKDMWYLREVLTGSIFRVVTKQKKISNCFWNFYIRR